MKPSSIFDAQVVSSPSVTMLSFTPIGSPNRGPRSANGTWSFSAASAVAFSLFNAKKAFTSSSSCSMRENASFVRSAIVKSPLCKPSCNSFDER